MSVNREQGSWVVPIKNEQNEVLFDDHGNIYIYNEGNKTTGFMEDTVENRLLLNMPINDQNMPELESEQQVETEDLNNSEHKGKNKLKEKEFAITLPESHRITENNDEKFAWQHKSTLLFLDEYKKRVSKFRNPKIKKKTLWEEIAGIMKCNGYAVDADALDRKMRNMKNTYRTILDNNNKKKTTGKGRIQWEYFSVFEEIFQEDKTVNSTPVMSSIQQNTTAEESSGSSRSPVDVIPPNFDDLIQSEVSSPSPVSNASDSGTPTTSKRAKSKQLDIFRKRQLDIEQEKVEELKKLRKCVEENNRIQQEKVDLLREMCNYQKNLHLV